MSHEAREPLLASASDRKQSNNNSRGNNIQSAPTMSSSLDSSSYLPNAIQHRDGGGGGGGGANNDNNHEKTQVREVSPSLDDLTRLQQQDNAARRPNWEDRANIFSSLTYYWFGPVIDQALAASLPRGEILPTSKEDGTTNVAAHLFHELKVESLKEHVWDIFFPRNKHGASKRSNNKATSSASSSSPASSFMSKNNIGSEGIPYVAVKRRHDGATGTLLWVGRLLQDDAVTSVTKFSLGASGMRGAVQWDHDNDGNSHNKNLAPQNYGTVSVQVSDHNSNNNNNNSRRAGGRKSFSDETTDGSPPLIVVDGRVNGEDLIGMLQPRCGGGDDGDASDLFITAIAVEEIDLDFENTSLTLNNNDETINNNNQATTTQPTTPTGNTTNKTTTTTSTSTYNYDYNNNNNDDGDVFAGFSFSAEHDRRRERMARIGGDGANPPDHPAKPSVFWALARSLSGPFIYAVVPRFLSEAAYLSSPVMLELYVDYLHKEERPGLWKEGVYIASALAGVYLVQSICSQKWVQLAVRSGLRMRSALIMCILQKALCISPRTAAHPNLSVGRIVTLASVDANMISNGCMYSVYVWSLPFQVSICIYLLYRLIGWIAFVSLGVTLLFIPITALVMRQNAKAREKMTSTTDQRTKLTTELFGSLKVIKCMGWEEQFLKSICSVRDTELDFLGEMQKYRVTSSFIMNAAPAIVMAVSLIIYHLTGNDMTPRVVFPVMSLLNILRGFSMMLPYTFQIIIDLNVSLKRLRAFFMSEDLEPYVSVRDMTTTTTGATTSFTSTTAAPPPTPAQSSVNFNINNNTKNNNVTSSTTPLPVASGSGGGGGGGGGSAAPAAIVATNLSVTAFESKNITQEIKDGYGAALTEWNLHRIENANCCRRMFVGCTCCCACCTCCGDYGLTAAQFAEEEEREREEEEQKQRKKNQQEQQQKKLNATSNSAAASSDSEKKTAASASLKKKSGNKKTETECVSSKVILKDVSLRIPHSKLTVIIGATGSGKSTLLEALLGFCHLGDGIFTVPPGAAANSNNSNTSEEQQNQDSHARLVAAAASAAAALVDTVSWRNYHTSTQQQHQHQQQQHDNNINNSGSLEVMIRSGSSPHQHHIDEQNNKSASSSSENLKVAYFPQQPWLMNGTVKENVIFFSPEDPDRFTTAVKCCQLESDLDVFPDRENTQVGTKGVQMSGGQKARTALSRCVYADADFYFLDDPLAAVDAHVGEILFKECICGTLAKKTRILVTHHLHFLHYADQIVQMEGGKIVFVGDFADYSNKISQGMIRDLSSELSRTTVPPTPASLIVTTASSGATAPATAAGQQQHRPSASPAAANGAAGDGGGAMFPANPQNSLLDDQSESDDDDDDDDDDDEEEEEEKEQQQTQTQNASPPSGDGGEELITSRLSSVTTTTTTISGGRKKSSPSSLKKKSSSSLLMLKSPKKKPGQQDEAPPPAPPPKKDQTGEEEVVSGEVSKQTFYSYFEAAGGTARIVFIFVWYFLTECMNQAQVVWLTFWAGKIFDLDANTYLYGYCGLVSLSFISAASRAWLMLETGRIASRSLHFRLLASLISARVTFFDVTPLGRILNRFSSDVDQLDNSLPMDYQSFLGIVFSMFSSLSIMLSSQPYILVALIPIWYIYFRIMKVFNASVREIKRIDSVNKSPIFAMLAEVVEGGKTILSFNKAIEVLKLGAKRIDNYFSTSYCMMIVNRWLGVRLELLGNATVACVAFAGVITKTVHIGVTAEKTTSGLIALGLTLSMQIVGLMNFLVRMRAAVEADMNSVERILQYSNDVDVEPVLQPGHIPENYAGMFQILQNERPEQLGTGVAAVAAAAATTNKKKKNGDVGGDVVHHQNNSSYSAGGGGATLTLNNISLRYRPGLPLVLNGVSFSLPPFCKCALVGRTGSSKSTLLNAFLRLVEIEDDGVGFITINGKDTRADMTLSQLRDHFSLIPQDPILFEGTVRSNLDPFFHATDEEVKAALDMVGMADRIFSPQQKQQQKDSSSSPTLATSSPSSQQQPTTTITLQEGLRMSVSDGGKNFSVGQRGLLCLARALLRKHAPIVLLDEATANIDPESDELVQKTIRSAFKDRTVITIAHRLNTIAHCDTVVVMDKGRAVQMGHPKELLKDKEGSFAQLVASQGKKGARQFERAVNKFHPSSPAAESK